MAFCFLVSYIDPVQYRLYRPDDFARLYALEEVCFEPSQRFPRFYMRQLVQSASAHTWIAEEDSVLAGFAIVLWSAENNENIAYVETIEVNPEYRRRGIGVALLHRLESSARSQGCSLIWLHVDEQNEAAIQLYCAHGYHKEGRRAHYYGRNRAASVYAKVLGP